MLNGHAHSMMIADFHVNQVSLRIFRYRFPFMECPMIQPMKALGLLSCTLLPPLTSVLIC